MFVTFLFPKHRFLSSCAALIFLSHHSNAARSHPFLTCDCSRLLICGNIHLHPETLSVSREIRHYTFVRDLFTMRDSLAFSYTKRKRQADGLGHRQCCGSSLENCSRFTFWMKERMGQDNNTANSWDNARSSCNCNFSKRRNQNCRLWMGDAWVLSEIHISEECCPHDAHSVWRSCHQRNLEEHPPTLPP